MKIMIVLFIFLIVIAGFLGWRVEMESKIKQDCLSKGLVYVPEGRCMIEENGITTWYIMDYKNKEVIYNFWRFE